jgi:hypothetical protein
VVRALTDTGRFSSFSIGDALKATILDLCGYKYLEDLQTLLAARTNSTLSHALSALEIAAGMGHVQVVKGLLATKLNDDANANQAGRGRTTLLDVLAERHCRDEPSMIAALSATSDADLSATAKAFVVWASVSWFANWKPDVDHLLPDLTIKQIACKDLRHGRTLLHWATERDYEPLVERCIRLGASVEAQDKYGKTPLQYAA